MFLIDVVRQDLRYAFRGLRNNKGLTFAIVVTLTLGLGVNGAVFSLLDRLFVRPPAGVAAPQSVRRIYVKQVDRSPETTYEDRFSYPQWTDLRNASTATPLTTYAVDSIAHGTSVQARRVVVTYIDSAYWSLLGVNLARGRSFSSDETRIDSPSNLVIVSDAFWRRELGANPHVIGEQVRLGPLAYTVIGVTPQGFTGTDLDETQLWLPLGAMPMPDFGGTNRWYQIRGVPLLRVLARISPDMNASVLETRLTSAFRNGSVATGRLRDSAAVVSTGSIISAVGPLKKRQEVALATRLPWLSVLVLFIALANVANLLLARAMRRQREIAVRLALGISRQRLAVQLLLESGLLALGAAVAAVIVGAWTGALLRRTLLPQIHWDAGLVDWRIAMVTGCAALVAALATGLAPLIHTWRFDLTTLLKSSSRAGSRSNRRVLDALVVTQTALAVALLCGAGLCIQSLRNVLNVDVGYDVARVVISEPRQFDDRGGEKEIPRAERGAAMIEAARRLRTTDRDGIQDVALALGGPMGSTFLTSVRIAGLDSTPMLNGDGPSLNAVSPEYAKTVGLRVIRGRFVNAEDREGSALVAVVNETMARTLWPASNAIGQCLKVYGINGACYTIVGIVRDARQSNIVESPRMQYFVPITQATLKGGAATPRALVIRYADGRTNVASKTVARVFRDVMPSVDANVRPMNALIAKQLRPWLLGASLFSTLGGLALFVALIGLYGVISLNVSRRTHEMGVRMALGAQRANVMVLVMREGIQTAAVGVAIGLALTLAGGRLLSTLLYDVSPYDPVVLAAGATLMLTAALLSTSAPALRATRADPAAAFRTE